MTNHRQEHLVSAPADVLYRALTTTEGLRAWWTPTCEAEPRVGGRAEFRFDRTRKVMRVVRLVPDREVIWKVEEADIDASFLSRRDEWVGTTIAFRLVPQPSGATLLQFEHEGLTPAFECYGICTSGWREFLASLADYAATGRGRPYGSACAAREMAA